LTHLLGANIYTGALNHLQQNCWLVIDGTLKNCDFKLAACGKIQDQDVSLKMVVLFVFEHLNMSLSKI